MSEFQPHPDGLPIPEPTEISEESKQAFLSLIERLSYAGSDEDGTIYGDEWYRDVITGEILHVLRERSLENGQWSDGCSLEIYEEPEAQRQSDSAQIVRSYSLDLFQPSRSKAEVTLHTYSADGREVFRPDNPSSVPTGAAYSDADELHKQYFRRKAMENQQREAGVHLDQLPSVGTSNQEFASVIPYLERIEESSRVNTYNLELNPVRLVVRPEEG